MWSRVILPREAEAALPSAVFLALFFHFQSVSQGMIKLHTLFIDQRTLTP